MSVFLHRGVIEGFYGEPWSHADRLWMIERLGSWGMNRYVYAPKNDPLHRGEWRTAYGEEALRDFAELIEAGARAGVEVGFAVSPGLSISYASIADRRALVDKFKTFQALGARFLSLAFDDVPHELVHESDRASFESLAHAQVAVVADLLDSLGSDGWFWLVPTDYLGVGPTDYLHVLGDELDPHVEVGWTGRTVVSPSISRDEAALRAATLKRKLLLWDNVPVADGPMCRMLHLGPYGRRDPELAEHASGILLNPMEQAHASSVALHTAASYLRDPQGYDPERAWNDALEELGSGDPEAFRSFAYAHRFSAIWFEDRDPELESGFVKLVELLEAGDDLVPALEELRGRVDVRMGAAERLRARLADRVLAAEIEPWLVAHERETRRLNAALEAARALLGGGTRGEKVRALLIMQGRLAREPEADKVSYGPRRVLYPQLVAMQEDEMSLGHDPALIRDRCLVDEIVEFVEDLGIWLLTRTDR